MMNQKNKGEFELIERFLSIFPAPSADVLVPPGDDCAVLTPDHQIRLVTTDLLVEDIHFTMASISPYQLGAKAMAVNLSDIAAMGGVPRHAFLSIAFKKNESLTVLDDIMMGIRDMCLKYGVALSGGDTTASPDRMIINICILGSAIDNRYLTRSGANPGDLIQISGPLGGSAAALSMILNGHDVQQLPEIARAHFMPEPRLAAGQQLCMLSGVTSMIDISDGLLQDLGHICSHSTTGAVVNAETIPLFSEAEKAAVGDAKQVLHWALAGGEDYELCWTVRPDWESRALDAARKAGATHPATIGFMTRDPGIKVLHKGTPWEIGRVGWDHFA